MEMIVPLVVLAFVVLVPGIYVMLQYNGLVALRNHIRESWADIDTELKRRYDLIPNLVSTVKGYAEHERQVLENVVALRNLCAANRGPVASQSADEEKLVAGLRQLMVVVEKYPDLKADAHFMGLQEELVRTEDRIQAARRFYNGNVRDYRNKREMFPGSLVAALFQFPSEDYFTVEATVRENPQVSL